MLACVDSRFVDVEHARSATGAVVVIDVLRAFTTAAYALAGGASRIILVGEVDEALALKRANPEWLAMGEVGGRRPDGFDLPNSPVHAASANLSGSTIVQRTSAGTRGVVNAAQAGRLWCASLVCASATARAVAEAGIGAPTYVITGDWPERADLNGDDDRLTAEHIERIRMGDTAGSAAVATAVAASAEARRTIALGDGHVDPADIEYATRVDHFDFAMEVRREDVGLVLRRSVA